MHTAVFLYIYIYIIIMSCHQHRYPWPSLATSPYHSSPPAGLQGYILCPHIVAVCKFELIVLLLHSHMWGSIGVHHLIYICMYVYIYIYIYIYNVLPMLRYTYTDIHTISSWIYVHIQCICIIILSYVHPGAEELLSRTIRKYEAEPCLTEDSGCISLQRDKTPPKMGVLVMILNYI